MVYKFTIIEDNLEAGKKLKDMIEKYLSDIGEDCIISSYSDGLAFLSGYKCNCDLVFMDIEMPGINGMETARRLREKDKNVMIVFVTAMAQYAVESYDVRAFDYILKPFSYSSFFMKFGRILNQLNHLLNEDILTVFYRDSKKVLKICDITYVEVSDHNLIYHTSNEEIVVRQTISEAEKKLNKYHFARCNSCYLVNLKYVEEIDGMDLKLPKAVLRISKAKKHDFLALFAAYVGGSI
ncbi:MAG: LytTR family DNA-binding domain-containing protein [Bacilli bacterium]